MVLYFAKRPPPHPPKIWEAPTSSGIHLLLKIFGGCGGDVLQNFEKQIIDDHQRTFWMSGKFTLKFFTLFTFGKMITLHHAAWTCSISHKFFNWPFWNLLSDWNSPRTYWRRPKNGWHSPILRPSRSCRWRMVGSHIMIRNMESHIIITDLLALRSGKSPFRSYYVFEKMAIRK